MEIQSFIHNNVLTFFCTGKTVSANPPTKADQILMGEEFVMKGVVIGKWTLCNYFKIPKNESIKGRWSVSKEVVGFL